MRLENEKQAKEVFEYCKSRLPKLEGFTLSVEEPLDEITKTPLYDGITLRLYFGDRLVSKWCGVDADDALLCIYRDLVLYYKELSEVTSRVTKALGIKHYSKNR